MQQRRAWVITLIIILWSGLMGWGLNQSQNAAAQDLFAQNTATTEIGTVDVVPASLKLSQEVYLKQCSSCHIALPPETYPSQTWEKLLLDQNHYGVTLPPLVNPELSLTWKYLQSYSRPEPKEAQIPFRFRQSRPFKILHPRVEFAEAVTVNTCASCHPAAPEFNFRKLTEQWKDAP
ncbi:MAG: diheme cytochrome C [Thermosynechococcaceae cyanobacterium]